MMKRYLTVFLALCLLLMTNVCFASSFTVTSHEDFGSRWVYVHSAYAKGFNSPFYADDEIYYDEYIDAASIHDITLRGRKLVEFTMWYRKWAPGEKMGNASKSDKNWAVGQVFALDLANHVCYNGPCIDDFWGNIPGETAFPPYNVYTTVSTIFYGSYYDDGKFVLNDEYKGMNAEQMVDSQYFSSSGTALGYVYDPQNYQATEVETQDMIHFQPIGISDDGYMAQIISTAMQIINSRGK